MKKGSKILSAILVLCMMVQILPVFASETVAEFTDEIEYLINDNFSAATDDNDGMDGWTLTDYNAIYTQDITAESVPEYEGSENYVLKYSAPDSDNGDGTLNSYLLRTLDEAVTFEEGKSIVLETRIMQTGGNADGGRSFLKFNMPAKYSSLDTWQNYNTLFYIKSGVLYTLNGYSNDGNAVMNDTVVSNNVSGKWLNVKITIDEDLNATYVIKSDDGSVDEVIEEQSLAHPEAAAFYQDVLENLAFRMRIGNTLYIDYVRMYELNSLTMGVNSRYAPNKPVTVTFDKADADFVNAVALYDVNGNEIEAVNTIDDTNTIVTIVPTEPLTEGNEYIVKFLASAVIGNYNVEDKKFLVSEIDYLIYDHFETEGDTDGWNHMAVTDEIYAGEVSQTTLDDENGNEVGVLKLTNDIDGKEVLGAQAGQQAGVIKSFDKTTVTEDTKLIIKTKVKYTEPEGRFYFKLNRPDSVNLPKNEWGGSLYSLLTMNKNGANYVDGTVVASNTEISSTQTMNTGSLSGKWVTAEFAVYKENGVDKYDVKINYEGNEKTAKGNFTQAARVYELHGIEGNAFDAFETLAFTTYYGVNTIYVDYVEAYTIIPVEMTVEEKYGTDKPITVTFDKANVNFVNAVALFDANGNKVDAVNTIDDTNTIVTITPANKLADGTYTVKFDTTVMDGNYVVENKTTMISDVEYLIYDTFGAATDSDNGMSGWVLKDYNAIYTQDITAESVPEYEGSENYVLKYSAPDSDNGDGTLNSYLLRNLDDAIAFEEGNNIVFETRIKQTGGNADGGRSFLKFNMPATYSTLDTWQNYNTLFYIKSGVLYTLNGYSNDGNAVMNDNVVSNNVSGKWLNVKITIDEDLNATYVIKSDDGSVNAVVEEQSLVHPEAAAFYQNVIDNLAFRMRVGNTLYIDYFKAYVQTPVEMTVAEKYSLTEPVTVTFDKANADFVNVVALYDIKGNKIEAVNTIDDNIVTITPVNPLAEGKYTVKFDTTLVEGNYFAEAKTFMVATRDYILYDHFEANGQTDGWNHMAVSDAKYAGEVSQTTLEDENGNEVGVLKLTNDIEGKEVLGAQAGQQAGVIKSFDKITITEGTKIVIKTKVKYTEPEGRFYFKLNRPDSVNLPKNEWGGSLYSLLTMNKNGANYVDGTVVANNTEISSTQTMNTGSLSGKWVTAEFAVYKENGVDKYDVKINYEGNEKTAKGNFTQPERVYELCGIEGKAFDAFETLAFTTYYGVNTIYVDYVEAYLESYEVPKDIIAPYITVGGETVTEFRQGATVVPKFELKPKYNAETTYTVISALYVDGLLNDVHMVPVTTTGETYTDTGFAIPSTATNATVKAFVWSGDGSMEPLCIPAEAELKLNAVYLSADGNDNATGTKEAPVATLAKAIELANASALEEGIKTAQVFVNDGTYYVDAPVEINATTKTVENLSICAVPGAKPVFMNAKKLTGTITKVTDEAILSRLNHVENAETVKANLYEYDLATALGGLYNIPSVDLPGSYSYQGNGKTYAGGTYNIPYTQDPTCELTFNGSLMTVARYPNTGYLTLTNEDIINAGSAPQKWGEFASDAEKLATPFEITNSRAANWENANQALMYGYFKYDWATQTVPVGSISGTNITSEFPAYYGLGDDNARRYYVYNLLEEIDQPYEYFIDRENGKIYFYIPGGVKATDEIAITLNNTFTIDINSPNVTIDGINFNGSRSGAIKSSSRNVIIKNCEISNTAQTAIYILGGRYNVVENCNIHDVNNAINVNAGDAKSLYTGGNIIRNNRISKFARLDKTYTYAVSLYGMGHAVEHNKIYDSEHAAIYFQGVENEIKNNDISNVCKETEDAGAIYAGRKWTSRDNKITGNYIHDISSNIETPSPVGAIFLDDHFADVQIDGNIFANINGTAIRGNAGREHNIANNIFVNCVQSAWITSYPTPSVEKYATQIADAQNFIYKNTEDASRAKYQEKYFDELYKYDEDGTTVIVNTDELIYGKGLIYKNNLTVSGKDDPEYKFGDLCEVTIEGNQYANNASTYFVNPESKDYTIKLSAIQSVIPGFVNIDFTAMKID